MRKIYDVRGHTYNNMTGWEPAMIRGEAVDLLDARSKFESVYGYPPTSSIESIVENVEKDEVNP